MEKKKMYLSKIKLRNLGLSTKIFFSYVIMLIITLLSVSALWYFNASSSLEDNAKQFMSSAVETINVQLDSYLKKTRTTANTIAYGYPEYNYVIENGPYDDLGYYMQDVRYIENNILKNIFAFSDNINGIVIVSKSGYMFEAGYATTTKDRFDEKYVQDTLSGERSMVYLRNNHKYGPSEDGEALSLGVPIKFTDKVIGSVIIDISYNSLEKLFNLQIKKTSNTHKMHIISVLPSGQILFDSQNETTINSYINDTNLETYFEKEEFSNSNKYLCYKSTAEYSGITTLGLVEKAELRSQINSGFSWTLKAAIVLLLVALLISYLITKKTMRNLMCLKNTMIKISGNNIRVRAKVNGGDEISQLAETFNFMLDRLEDLLNRIKEEEKEIHRMELEIFRSQINPHFLNNTLVTIKHLANLRGARNISEVTVSLSHILKSSLQKNKEFSSLKDEMELLQNYVNIQKFKFNNKINLITDLDYKSEKAILPKMILQPLVENSLFHGYNESSKNILIKIYSEIINGDLFISVEDHGAGLSEEKINKLLDITNNEIVEAGNKIHVGIRNVNKRLQLYYGKDYGLRIKSKKSKYTIVTIKLPYKLKRNED